jgi:hypothetical protein
MTSEQMIEEVEILVNDSRVSQETISTYLAIAEQRILQRMYPFKDDLSALILPTKHEHDVCELASRMIIRRGFEGQTHSTENGVHRVFKTVDDEDILMRVTQCVGVI